MEQRMPAKKRTVAKKAVTKARPTERLSVKLKKDTDKFWSFQPSVQTVYWVLIGIGIVGTAVINFNTNMRVNELVNQIESQNAALDSTPVVKKH
jgi:hypothetical protein